MTTVSFSISGMNCCSCSFNIEIEVEKISGVENIDIDYIHGTGIVVFNPKLTNFSVIKQTVSKLGYQLT